MSTATAMPAASRSGCPRAVPSRDGGAGQRGVALVTVLFMLLVMTLLALAGLRGTLMEERMSAGSYDRSLSFQAAEAALREGEASIVAGTRCSSGACPRPAAGTADIWVTDPTCADPTIWTPVTAALQSNSPPTVYAIELLGPAPPPNEPGCGLDGDTSCMVDFYRITACSGDPANGRAQTILQSNFYTH